VNNKIVIVVVVACVALLGGGVMLASRKPAPNPKLDEFAKCISDSGAIMYGAYWCPHCQNQKRQFGTSFQYINYVECTVDVQKCTDAKIDGYPTWVFKDGSRQTGELTFQQLAVKTSCTVPAN